LGEKVHLGPAPPPPPRPRRQKILLGCQTTGVLGQRLEKRTRGGCFSGIFCPFYEFVAKNCPFLSPPGRPGEAKLSPRPGLPVCRKKFWPVGRGGQKRHGFGRRLEKWTGSKKKQQISRVSECVFGPPVRFSSFWPKTPPREASISLRTHAPRPVALKCVFLGKFWPPDRGAQKRTLLTEGWKNGQRARKNTSNPDVLGCVFGTLSVLIIFVAKNVPFWPPPRLPREANMSLCTQAPRLGGPGVQREIGPGTGGAKRPHFCPKAGKTDRGLEKHPRSM